MGTFTDKEKELIFKQPRSDAVKSYVKFVSEGGVPETGAGKGKEPIENWCACHNRDPCPKIAELEKKFGIVF